MTNWFITFGKPFYTTTSQIIPLKFEIMVKSQKILKSVQIVWLTFMPSFEYNWVSSSNPNPDSLLMKYIWISFTFYGVCNCMFEYRLEGQSLSFLAFRQILVSYSKFLMPRPLKSGGAGGAIASPEFVMKFCFSYFFGYLRLYGTWIGKQQKWYFVTIIVLTYCEKKLF